MDEILDENMEFKPGSRYSKLSFFTAINSLVVIVYLISLIPKNLKMSVFAEPTIVAPIILMLSVLLGLIFTIQNIRKKEKRSFLKLIGNTLNIILAIVVFGSIIYAQTLDYLRNVG